jgi:hypothetical protein
MSLIDRFRRQASSPQADTAPNNDRPAQAPKPKPKTLRLAGQIRQDDIFPSSTDPQQ